MITKLFEIRDRATRIAVIGIKFKKLTEQECHIVSACGYGHNSVSQSSYVLMAPIDGSMIGQIAYDVYDWGDHSRTFKVAHQYIIDNFDDLNTGSVVDVEYILGESDFCKTPEY